MDHPVWKFRSRADDSGKATLSPSRAILNNALGPMFCIILLGDPGDH